jgi:hypothetical protein
VDGEGGQEHRPVVGYFDAQNADAEHRGHHHRASPTLAITAQPL